MRVAVAVESWAGVSDDPTHDVAFATLEAWRDASPHAEVSVTSVPSGGATSAVAFAGETVDLGGCVGTRVGAALWLRPGGSRWSPEGLGQALRAIAADATLAGPVVVPVGDDSPAGDATALWGGDASGMRQEVSALSLVVLTSSNVPLVGFHGMSSALRDGREGDDAVALAAQEQERRWLEVATEGDAVASRHALLGASRLSDMPGSGAAGGLAYCLAVVGGALMPAADVVLEASGFAAQAEDADLLVVVVPSLVPRALDHGPVAGVARLAAQRGVPAVVIAGDVHVGKRDLMNAGLAGAHEGDQGIEGLRDAVHRTAHTWTRR